MTLLQMSFSGALMILVITALRFLLQRNVHRNVWILLWLVVVLRLILPFTLPAATSFYNLPLFHEASAQMQNEATEEPALQPIPTETTAPQSVSAVNIPKVIWLSGAALVFIIVLGNHLQNLRRYRTSLPCTASLPPLPKGVQVRMLDNLDTPLTYGLFKPTILLPASFPMSDTQRLNHVLQHELSHIRHRDVFTKLTLITAAAIHWFNPFVWLMLYLASQDMEMRCDAQAVALLGNERLAYARSLVAAEEDRICGYLQAGFSHSATERRILALSKDRAVPVLSAVVCTAMLLLLSAVFMTGQAEASTQDVPIEPTPEVIAEPQLPTQEDPPAPESAPDESELTKPESTESEPTEPEPTEPESTEPESTEPESTEPESTEPESTEPEPTEPEPDTSYQPSYNSPAPPAPSQEPFIEPINPEEMRWEMPGDYSVDLSPPPNYSSGQPQFPVVVLPDPTPQINYPVPGANVPGHKPTMPGY